MSPEQRTVIEVEGRRLSVSNLDKVLYPEAGFTKADVIWYYVHVAPALLPHTQGRPLTVTRYPDGVNGQSFFEKHTAGGSTRVGPLRPTSRATPGPDGANFIEQLVLDDLPTLVWVANLAALELHVPQWRSVEPDGLRARRPDGLRPGPRCAGHRGGVLHRRGLASGGAQGAWTRRVPQDQRLEGDAALRQARSAPEVGGSPRSATRDRPTDGTRPPGGGPVEHAQGSPGRQSAHRLEPEPRRQDDDRAVLAPCPALPDGLDAS